MKLKFLGATGTVTGSKYLLTAQGKQILIDCGLFQGLKELRLRNWEAPPIKISEIDCIILTHAHIDHSGYIPRLVKMGFTGKIYCTHATFDLCKVLLPDSGFLMEEEAKYANKEGFSKHHPALPLFTLEDAEEALTYFEPVHYDQKLSLGKDITVEFRNAGHILGASMVIINDGKKTICFSGDLGRQDDPIMYPPTNPGEVDYLVMESTYGNRVHPESNPMDELADLVNEAYRKKGVIIVPAFAVGRAQALLYYLSELKKNHRIPDLPIFLNSPMAINVTGLYGDYSNICKLNAKECSQMQNVATMVKDPEDSKNLNLRSGPMVIVSASGMATGGRVIHHIKAFAPDPKNIILFTGFQAAGTRGEKMLSGAPTIRMHGQDIPVNAKILNLENISAHADSNELLQWLKNFKKPPQKVFITHGEPTAAATFQEKVVNELGWKAVVPNYLDEEEL